MSAFPKSAVGLISLFIFVAWLVFMMEIPQISDPIDSINIANEITFNNIRSAGDNIMSGDEGLFGFGIISSFFVIVWNLLLIPILFVISILIELVLFISVLTMLPIQISGIIIALLSVGLILSLLKFIIPE